MFFDRINWHNIFDGDYRLVSLFKLRNKEMFMNWFRWMRMHVKGWCVWHVMLIVVSDWLDITIIIWMIWDDEYSDNMDTFIQNIYKGDWTVRVLDLATEGIGMSVMSDQTISIWVWVRWNVWQSVMLILRLL